MRFSAIGDLLLCEPLPRLLKQRRPGLRIDLVTRDRLAAIPRGWPAVDRVWTPREPAGPRELADLRGRLDAEGPWRWLDLHNNLRSRLLLKGRGERLPKHRLQKLGLVRLPRSLHGWLPQPPPVWRRLQLLAGVPESEHSRPRLVIQGQELRWRDPGPEAAEILVPGAGKATKSWPVAHWRTLLEGLLEASPRPVEILGGPREKELGEQLRRRAPGRVRNLCGELGLEESARRLVAGRRIVTGDTGLLHMADAAGLPGVALYGSTTRELGFFPAGESLRVLERPVACRPCSHVGRDRCPRGHFRCMEELAPREVLAAYLES